MHCNIWGHIAKCMARCWGHMAQHSTMYCKIWGATYMAHDCKSWKHMLPYYGHMLYQMVAYRAIHGPHFATSGTRMCHIYHGAICHKVMAIYGITFLSLYITIYGTIWQKKVYKQLYMYIYICGATLHTIAPHIAKIWGHMWCHMVAYIAIYCTNLTMYGPDGATYIHKWDHMAQCMAIY